MAQATSRIVFNLLLRIWREICSPKLRRAYYVLWTFVFVRLTLHIGYNWSFGQAVQHLTGQTSFGLALLPFTVPLTIIVSEYALDWQIRIAFDKVMSYFFTAAEALIDQRFFEKSVGQHAGESGNFTQGAMSRGRSDLLGVNEFLAAGGFESLLSAGVNLGGVWLFSPRHGAIVTLAFATSLWWARSGNKQVYADQRRIGESERLTRRRREDLWDAIRRVKTSGRERDVIVELHQRAENMHEEYRLSWRKYQDWTLIRDLINWFGFSLVMIWNVYDLYVGATTLGSFLVIASTTYAALASVRPLSRLERKLFLSAPHIERLFELLDLPPDITDVETAVALPTQPFAVRLENVYLRRGERSVLRDLSFTIEPGDRVALIGPSGAGKTSIAELLERAMNPSAGQILIDDIDLRQVRLADWYKRVAFVSQTRYVIDGTLRDNILFGLSGTDRAYWSDERLWALARQFRVDFGDRLTQGLNTPVGRHGLQLSGGEAQRLLILAAAVKAPQFMVIDEATSALDAENQREVQLALDQLLLRTGASALIIAHRLSTIRQCTKFIVLRPVNDDDLSQIEAIASSLEELYVLSPTYRKLRQLEHDTPIHAPTIPEA